jgi:hypothetical protein
MLSQPTLISHSFAGEPHYPGQLRSRHNNRVISPFQIKAVVSIACSATGSWLFYSLK